MAASGFSEQGEWDIGVGTVRGYRSWSLHTEVVPSTVLPEAFSDPYALLPTATRCYLTGAYGGEWHYRKLEAECCYSSKFLTRWPVHEVPGPDCSCGIYAYWRCRQGQGDGPAEGVYGVVECSGRIIMGTKGFRAQRARIIAVVANDTILNRVTSNCNPGPLNGVELYEDYASLVKDYPPDIPPEVSQNYLFRNRQATEQQQ